MDNLCPTGLLKSRHERSQIFHAQGGLAVDRLGGAAQLLSLGINEHRMERDAIRKLFEKLEQQPLVPFPQGREKLAASDCHGVYVIRNPSGEIEHVGRTLRGRGGLFRRLRRHLGGRSSFMHKRHQRNGKLLRDGYTFQFLVVDDGRERALLEHYATAWHCPAHLGLGSSSAPPNDA
jgi:hypothetical protein